jgi:hypothetical protein
MKYLGYCLVLSYFSNHSNFSLFFVCFCLFLFCRLIELDEGIEALEVVIEYKSDTIESKKQQLQTKDDVNNELKNQIQSLPKEEAINLLSKYLDKVIQLRQHEGKLQLDCNDKDVKINEQERIIGELQRGLQQSLMAAERKVMKLQREHEKKIQFLMSQLRDAENAINDEGKERLIYTIILGSMGGVRYVFHHCGSKGSGHWFELRGHHM